MKNLYFNDIVELVQATLQDWVHFLFGKLPVKHSIGLSYQAIYMLDTHANLVTLSGRTSIVAELKPSEVWPYLNAEISENWNKL